MLFTLSLAGLVGWDFAFLVFSLLLHTLWIYILLGYLFWIYVPGFFFDRFFFPWSAPIRLGHANIKLHYRLRILFTLPVHDNHLRSATLVMSFFVECARKTATLQLCRVFGNVVRSFLFRFVWFACCFKVLEGREPAKVENRLKQNNMTTYFSTPLGRIPFSSSSR